MNWRRAQSLRRSAHGRAIPAEIKATRPAVGMAPRSMLHPRHPARLAPGPRGSRWEMASGESPWRWIPTRFRTWNRSRSYSMSRRFGVRAVRIVSIIVSYWPSTTHLPNGRELLFSSYGSAQFSHVKSRDGVFCRVGESRGAGHDRHSSWSSTQRWVTTRAICERLWYPAPTAGSRRRSTSQLAAPGSIDFAREPDNGQVPE